MNKLIVAALLAISSLAAGCLGCSGFTGGSDRVVARNSDSIILCENSGFVATTTSGVLEGTWITNADGSMIGTTGGAGSTAFVLTWNGDGTATTTDLGDGNWTERPMNATELDHADVQCQDLVSRSWWSAE
ncbi:MAG: hypothetical protein ABI591_20460 [Kofleriaceae bacterium]